jgi:hypothetical protein
MSSEARFLINVIGFALVDGLLIVACVFAWLKGGAAERYGASLYFLSALLSLAVAVLTRDSYPIVPMLVFEGLVALGFLALAVRYNSLWLGAAMMLKGAQLALHASHLTDNTEAKIGIFKAYPLLLNGISIAISLSILFGTVASLKARSRREDQVLA